MVEFGRHKGLKIPRALTPVPVQVRPSVESFILNKFCILLPIFYINYANARIHTLLKKSEKTHDEIMSVSLKGMGDDADKGMVSFLITTSLTGRLISYSETSSADKGIFF